MRNGVSGDRTVRLLAVLNLGRKLLARRQIARDLLDSALREFAELLLHVRVPDRVVVGHRLSLRRHVGLLHRRLADFFDLAAVVLDVLEHLVRILRF